jgi:Transposase.
MATIIWDAKEGILADIMPRGQTINPDLYAKSPKTTQRSIQLAQKNLLKSSFNMTKHDHKT